MGLRVKGRRWRWTFCSSSTRNGDDLIGHRVLHWSIDRGQAGQAIDRCPARRLLLRPLFPSYAFVTPVSRHWRSDVPDGPWFSRTVWAVDARSKYVKFQQSQFRVHNVTVIDCVLCSLHIQYMDSIWAMMTLWRMRGKITGTVLCCVCNNPNVYITLLV